MQEHNEVAGGTWEEFTDRNFPGPRWAYAISGLPLIGWIGLIAIMRAHRAQRESARRKLASPPDP